MIPEIAWDMPVVLICKEIHVLEGKTADSMGHLVQVAFQGGVDEEFVHSV